MRLCSPALLPACSLCSVLVVENVISQLPVSSTKLAPCSPERHLFSWNLNPDQHFLPRLDLWSWCFSMAIKWANHIPMVLYVTPTNSGLHMESSLWSVIVYLRVNGNRLLWNKTHKGLDLACETSSWQQRHFSHSAVRDSSAEGRQGGTRSSCYHSQLFSS